MNSGADLRELVARETRLACLLEPSGPLRAWWGAAHPEARDSVSFRKFHAPRVKTPSAWGEFPGAAAWTFAETAELKHRLVQEIPPLERPAEGPVAPRADWDALCTKADAALRAETAHKLVLAREARIPLSRADFGAILRGVTARLFAPAMENSYRFLLKSGHSAFFGATPELLFRRDGGLVHVPAVAGTRALAAGVPESDLRDELLASEKDRAEHEWVVDGICESLRELGLKPTFPHEPVVLRVPRLLHLYTPITAVDQRGLAGERLIEALHPTPAIGGHPRGAARDFLLAEETFDRGLFSAPLLFKGHARELCLVAIRSALLTPENLHFFAGAGYVRGSTCDAEWTETDRKLQVMQTILFGEKNVR